MRETKFKFWDKIRKDWVHNLINNNQFLAINWDAKYLYVFNEGNPFELNFIYSFSEIDIIEYTGLKDKNRKEIYEGDIIAWEKSGNVLGSVTFEYGMFYLRNDSLYHYICSQMIEVIGNIYKNPELLKNNSVKNR